MKIKKGTTNLIVPFSEYIFRIDYSITNFLNSLILPFVTRTL